MYAYVYVQHSSAGNLRRRVQGEANEVMWQYCSSETLYRFEHCNAKTRIDELERLG